MEKNHPLLPPCSRTLFGIHRHNQGRYPPRPRSRATARVRVRVLFLPRPPAAMPARLCVTSPQSESQSDSKRVDLVTCSFLACQPSRRSMPYLPLHSSPYTRARILLPSLFAFSSASHRAQVVMENRTHRPSDLYAFLCDEVQRAALPDRIGHSSTRSPPPPPYCCRFISNFDLPVRVAAASRVRLNGQ